MSSINSARSSRSDTLFYPEVKVRHAVQDNKSGVLADIYRDENNLVIWQRELSDTLKKSVNTLLKVNPTFQAVMTVTPQSALSSISESLGGSDQQEISENIAELVDMFCYLFDLKRAGLRLTALDRAMCPKFHVDKIPCRLVTTFQGVGTQWLPHQSVNREKMGAGSHGLSDNQSGLYKSRSDIKQLNSGEVALLKGELWEGNENAGLVHRSPSLTENERRLLLTLDFSH